MSTVPNPIGNRMDGGAVVFDCNVRKQHEHSQISLSGRARAFLYGLTQLADPIRWRIYSGCDRPGHLVHLTGNHRVFVTGLQRQASTATFIVASAEYSSAKVKGLLL